MGRPAGSPNKLTAEIKEKLSSIINDALDSLDVKTMSKVERLKLIQIGVQYIVPRLKQVEEVTDEPPRQFQIEVITSRSQLSDKI
ncbi:hypothetical protein N8221_01390 [Flavobacteriaceae bacterium]|nr:hypothetical protein [Flavobacteriaceae bacterium]|tara:strand:+ start:37 stop:291 length:255 start_codon:yes stop_codon:yes gene_type:complete